MKPIVIRSDNRETYLFSHGSVAKVDVIRSPQRMEIIVEYCHMPLPDRGQYHTERFVFRDAVNFQKAYDSLMASLHLEGASEPPRRGVLSWFGSLVGKGLSRIRNVGGAERARQDSS